MGEHPGDPSPVRAKGYSHSGGQATGKSSPSGYDEVVITKNAETIDTFFFSCHTHEDRESLPRGKN